MDTITMEGGEANGFWFGNPVTDRGRFGGSAGVGLMPAGPWNFPSITRRNLSTAAAGQGSIPRCQLC